MDTVPGNRTQDKVNSQSTISRFACRIISEREVTEDGGGGSTDDRRDVDAFVGAGDDEEASKKMRTGKRPARKCRIYAAGFDSSRNIFLGKSIGHGNRMLAGNRYILHLNYAYKRPLRNAGPPG